MTSERDVSLHGSSLFEIACSNNGSPRLRNSLELAMSLGTMPFATVSDYLASSAAMGTLKTKVRNFGGRTALELDGIIRDLARAADATSAEPAPEGHLVAAEVEKVRRELAGICVRQLLGPTSPGTKLDRVMRSEVGDWSALSAIENPERVRARVLEVPTAGGVTAEEVETALRVSTSKMLRRSAASSAMHDALISVLFEAGSGPCWYNEEEVEAASDHRTVQLIREVLGDLDCTAAFAESVVPVRLARLVHGVGKRLVVDALFDRSDFDRNLFSVKNVGRKTVVEFWDLIWRRFALALARVGVTDEDRAAMALVLRVHPDSLNPDPEDMAEQRPLIAGANGGSDRGSIPRELNDLQAYMLDRIRAQDAAIVRRRFGLEGRSPETLEEIGADLRITRERVRQIEKRGLGDLVVLMRKVDLRGALDANVSLAWEALANGDDMVTELEFATFRRSVPGSTTLALRLLGLELAEWLSQVSHAYPKGWLAPHRDREPVGTVIAALDAMPDDLLLPRALSELGLPGSPQDVEAAILIGRGLRTLHGYLVDGHIGLRRRRSLVAHALLARAGVPMSLTDLLGAYHRAAPGDQCSTRDLTIVMSDAPHLFLEVNEWRWASVGAGGEIPAGGRPREIDVAEEGLPEVDLTVATAIRDELERSGPQPLASLADDPRRYLPPGRSQNSVQPTLIMRPDLFARLLPGVYGLWSQIPNRDEVLAGDVPYLLNEQQARIFALARRAEEPWGTFPMWSPEAEYRLCRWAVAKGSVQVRRSLLATATVEVWPLEAEERDEWRKLCARNGRYDLVATVRNNVFSLKPDLDRVLAALLNLKVSGRTSWMTLNRVDGRHVASQMSCALLAVLVLSGAVSTPDQSADSPWQLSHEIRRTIVAEMEAALSSELHVRGSLEWSSDAGRMVATRILAGERRAPPWLPFHRFSQLFRQSADEPSAPVEITPETAGSVGRALLAERRTSDLLEWLDVQ